MTFPWIQKGSGRKKLSPAFWALFFVAVVVFTQSGDQHGQISGWLKAQFGTPQTEG